MWQKEGKSAVDVADFNEAIDRVVGGLEKKNRDEGRNRSTPSKPKRPANRRAPFPDL